MSSGKANQQFKELKDILQETNQRILGLELKLTNNQLTNNQRPLRTMMSTLIFKNIPGIQKESCEDTFQHLADFFICELDLPYSFEEIDFQIS